MNIRPQSFVPDHESCVLSAEEIKDQTNSILNQEKFQACSEEYKKGLRLFFGVYACL
jgi:hypothetical protein